MKVLCVTFYFLIGAIAIKEVPPREGPACPLEDPLSHPHQHPINITLDPILALLEGSSVNNVDVEGLSFFHYNVDLTNIILPIISFELNLGSASGNATYFADGYLDFTPLSQSTFPSGNLTGSGFGKISATGIHLKGLAKLSLNGIIGYAYLIRLELETVSFDSVEIDLGSNITIGSEAPNWNEINREIKENFDREFTLHKAEIEEKIRVTLIPMQFHEIMDWFLNPPEGDC